MLTVKKEKVRQFGGELFVRVDKKNRPVEDRLRRNFETKHLRAYLRGDKRFSFGKDEHGFPMYFPVNEVWIDKKVKLWK